MAIEPIFFEAPASLRDWLAEHHDTATEVLVGFHKKHTGRPTVTWPEAVDEALCVGWIDGVRKGIDDDSYMIRFTPRKPRSIWSAVNIRRVAELTREGRMRLAGQAAFEARQAVRSEVYAYEQRTADLDPELRTRFEANKPAWAFYQAQPAGYRKTANWWVTSAKQEATRMRRLATLIEDSAHGRRIGSLVGPASKSR